MTEIRLSPLQAEDLLDEPDLEAYARETGEGPWLSRRTRGQPRQSAACVERPFDLRFSWPIAYDLRKLAKALDCATDPQLEAMLGPNVPLILHHQFTPFAEAGESQSGVWGLGYEFEPQGINARTISVAPSNESLTVGSLCQQVKFGLGVDGVLRVPSTPLSTQGTPFRLPGVSIEASTSHGASLCLNLSLTLQKVVGAGFGQGGAKWNLYRQDEPLSVPHVLVQTIVVPKGTSRIPARIRMWAKQAGWFGTSFRGRLWPYPEQHTVVSLQ